MDWCICLYSWTTFQPIRKDKAQGGRVKEKKCTESSNFLWKPNRSVGLKCIRCIFFFPQECIFSCQNRFQALKPENISQVRCWLNAITLQPCIMYSLSILPFSSSSWPIFFVFNINYSNQENSEKEQLQCVCSIQIPYLESTYLVI